MTVGGNFLISNSLNLGRQSEITAVSSGLLLINDGKTLMLLAWWFQFKEFFFKLVYSCSVK